MKSFTTHSKKNIYESIWTTSFNYFQELMAQLDKIFNGILCLLQNIPYSLTEELTTKHLFMKYPYNLLSEISSTFDSFVKQINQSITIIPIQYKKSHDRAVFNICCYTCGKLVEYPAQCTNSHSFCIACCSEIVLARNKFIGTVKNWTAKCLISSCHGFLTKCTITEISKFIVQSSTLKSHPGWTKSQYVKNVCSVCENGGNVMYHNDGGCSHYFCGKCLMNIWKEANPKCPILFSGFTLECEPTIIENGCPFPGCQTKMLTGELCNLIGDEYKVCLDSFIHAYPDETVKHLNIIL